MTSVEQETETLSDNSADNQITPNPNPQSIDQEIEKNSIEEQHISPAPGLNQELHSNIRPQQQVLTPEQIRLRQIQREQILLRRARQKAERRRQALRMHEIPVCPSWCHSFYLVIAFIASTVLIIIGEWIGFYSYSTIHFQPYVYVLPNETYIYKTELAKERLYLFYDKKIDRYIHQVPNLTTPIIRGAGKRVLKALRYDCHVWNLIEFKDLIKSRREKVPDNISPERLKEMEETCSILGRTRDHAQDLEKRYQAHLKDIFGVEI